MRSIFFPSTAAVGSTLGPKDRCEPGGVYEEPLTLCDINHVHDNNHRQRILCDLGQQVQVPLKFCGVENDYETVGAILFQETPDSTSSSESPSRL